MTIPDRCVWCEKVGKVCDQCHRCKDHCTCNLVAFDADELGLDPETDNTPDTGSRHA